MTYQVREESGLTKESSRKAEEENTSSDATSAELIDLALSHMTYHV